MSDISPSRPLPRILDVVEKFVVALLLSALAYRIFLSMDVNPWNILFLIGEATVVLFVLLRRGAGLISLRPVDWVIGFAGTCLPLLLIPNGNGWLGAVPILLAGLLISIGAKLSLRRSFGIVAANRGIKTSGLYAVVRHPMYLGYFLTEGAALALNPSVWNASILTLWAILQLSRIHAEERILMQDNRYQQHAVRVRYRLLPFIY
ncbi:isoprenylcysteine carboxylmethyltransferase family protein [uncultured Brevundimonas sp.]|uniref:methyltransferase family protein n=1 Tax=uncultured Brevundimonas sp. TaxID=213418 RepID=UPI002619B239|nr:isoprenylcysteine carboxylmethyltransferase family protein [uncultured Brevundimonas sp.]